MALQNAFATFEPWLTWHAATVDRFRDALRAFRGKRPKYSELARQLEAEQRSRCHSVGESAHGICTEEDVRREFLTAEEQALLRDIVESSRNLDGPIVQFGTLLGETATSLCLAKSPRQKLIAVDPGDANPWNLSPATYRELVSRLLNYPLRTGDAVHEVCRLRDVFKNINSSPPALVFLNYVGQYEDAVHIIQWAKSVGAGAIAGRGYDYSTPGIVKAVDEFGGPDALEGGLWQLSLKQSPSMAVDVAKSPSPPIAQASNGAIELKDLVSIVVPAYNARGYIAQTLEDIRRQLYRDWELIVVEDGSADDVEAIIADFQRQCPYHRIAYHRKSANSGVSSTRNVGMGFCRGQFVAFLDADDRWSPDHLQRKVRLLHQTKADLAYSRIEMFDSDSDQALCHWGPTEAELQSFPDSMFGRPYVHPSAVVVRKSLLADVGFFDEQLHFAEDYDYWFRAAIAGKRFAFDEKVTARYRKNHQSAATTDRLVACYEGIARVTGRHISNLGVGDAERRRTVIKHFLTAGTGHLAYLPTERNGCSARVGQELLRQGWRIAEDNGSCRAYYMLARLAVATKSTSLMRRIFRRKYKQGIV